MNRFKYRIVFAVATIIFLLQTGQTCGPDFGGVVFIRQHGPDAPINAFTSGQIGIPLPGWWRSYLVVAYRYLEDKPLSQAEGRSFAELWGAEKSFGVPADPAEKALARWIKARSQYAGGSANHPKAYRETQFYSLLNCASSAFETAIETLQARARRFGPHSNELRLWISGQDDVFRNCQGGSFYPEKLPANADPLLKADRAYQLAAARFYSESYEHARTDFDAISKNSSSPWHSIAPYLAARAVIRQSGAAYGDGGDTKLLQEAAQRLQAILADPAQKQWHHDARKLANLVAFRLEPLPFQHRLARDIARGSAGEDFGQNVRDYTLLLDKRLDTQPDFPGVESYGEEYDQKVSQWHREQYQVMREERTDDLTDWLMTIQADSKAAREHAIKKWRVTRSTPWLYAVLTKLQGTDPESTAAAEAAGKTASESPVFIALNYHRARLLGEKGDLVQEQEILNKLGAKQGLSLSTLNLIKDEQTKLSADRKVFASLLPRAPVRLTYDWYDDTDNGCYNVNCKLTFYGTKNPLPGSPLLPQFDPRVALLLNTRIPTEELVEIVNQKSLPAPLQRRIALAVWARAALLDQQDLAAKVGEAVSMAEPELKRFVQELASAGNQDERRFVAAFAIAHFPGLRPFVDSAYPRQTEFAKADNYRDNWWCSDVGGVPEENNYAKQSETHTGLENPSIPAPAFLTADQAQKAEKEWQALLGLGTAEEYLPRALIAWAKAHPQDPRVPEALHFSWRVSRYSCGAGDPHHYNHEVFRMLHKSYPKSEWTKKTRVWFD